MLQIILFALSLLAAPCEYNELGRCTDDGPKDPVCAYGPDAPECWER